MGGGGDDKDALGKTVTVMMDRSPAKTIWDSAHGLDQ